MMRCYLPRSLAALALLTMLPTTRATSVVAPNFDQLVGKSDYIVRATVKSVVSEWRANPEKSGERYIGTLVALDVKETIKGTPPSPLVLDLVGGRVGDQELTIEGAPKFIVGQESILFVQGNGRQIIPLVGMMHGYYSVKRDKRTSETQVMRSSGQYLYSEQEVSLPESTPVTTAVRDPKARPLSAAEFSARIRKSKNFSQRDLIE